MKTYKRITVTAVMALCNIAYWIIIAVSRMTELIWLYIPFLIFTVFALVKMGRSKKDGSNTKGTNV